MGGGRRVDTSRLTVSNLRPVRRIGGSSCGPAPSPASHRARPGAARARGRHPGDRARRRAVRPGVEAHRLRGRGGAAGRGSRRIAGLRRGSLRRGDGPDRGLRPRRQAAADAREGDRRRRRAARGGGDRLGREPARLRGRPQPRPGDDARGRASVRAVAPTGSAAFDDLAQSITVDASDNLYVADTRASRIQRVRPGRELPARDTPRRAASSPTSRWTPPGNVYALIIFGTAGCEAAVQVHDAVGGAGRPAGT